MTPGSPYNRPPIVEAIVDIRVDLADDFPVSSLLKAQKAVKADYPEVREARLLSGESSASAERVGFRFASPDGRRVFQARHDGFTFNWLESYPGWDMFIAEAKRLWFAYRSHIGEATCGPMSLRYIDRIDIPLAEIRLETYFRTYPAVPGDLPQAIQGFFLQYDLPIQEISALATVIQTQVPSIVPRQCSIILDTNIVRAVPPDDLWLQFEAFRIWKNKIFESCITDTTRELFR